MAITDDQREQELLRIRKADPFTPFVLSLNSGERFLITDPLSFAVVGGKLMLPGKVTGKVAVGDIKAVEMRKQMTQTELELRSQLMERLVHKPFEPFTIRMRNGANYEIARPLQAGIGQTRGYLVTADGTRGVNFRIQDIQAVEERKTA